MFKRLPLKALIVWVLLASAYVISLSFYKGALLGRLAQEAVGSVQARHTKVLGLFQGSFYFFFEDQFLPGIRQNLDSAPGPQGVLAPRQIVVLGEGGAVLFDSGKSKDSGKPSEDSRYPDASVVAALSASGPRVFVRGFGVHVLMPSGQYGILYAFDGSPVRNRVLGALVLGFALALLLARAGGRGRLQAGYAVARGALRRAWRLRMKFVLTIILINLVTAGIVFYTLSSLQTREQTQRIEKESLLFSQFSTARVISDFTNYYYFYYLDRFLPEVKSIFATNENLVGIRIISRRTGAVLFDSELAAVGPQPGALPAAGEAVKADFPPDVEELLATRGYVTRYFPKDGDRILSVINTYRNESQEALFWVEYLFSFQTLKKSIQAIREQILIDLVPSLSLGLLVAVLFAQFLISPIRRLGVAVQKVAAGDFNVQVDARGSDEIAELVQAFNGMTTELRKKKELRKYLSDSTYRQIMNAMESPDGGLKVGGSRVAATVLFSDIRDFVAHCENLDAEEVTAMLNEYFSEMVDVVYKHGGEVDKFIGDALLAVFYAGDEVRTIRPAEPFYGPSSAGTALQAIYCALEMRERLAEFNERRRSLQKRTLEIGVGITHGEIISGPIGAKDRMDFTVIGDVVNLANRIEKLSKTGKFTKIVFSNHVEEKIRGLLEYVEHSKEKVRGKQEDVTIYELVGIRDLETLVSHLRGADLSLRRRSIELLGQSRNPAALPYVIESLRDPDEGVRLGAVIAIGKLASPNEAAAVEAVLSALRAEKSDKVVSSLITAVGKVCTSERIFEIVPFLDSPKERIVANTIEALAQARDPRCSDLILPKLNSRNNRIKANAAMALFAAGHVEVIDTLKPMLMHSDHLMRSSAAFALGELTLIAEYSSILRRWKDHDALMKMFLAEVQDCVPMLVALLRDPEPIVRRQAVIALGKIKDKSSVLPIIDMVDLERNSKELSRDIREALRSIGSHKLVREVIERLT
ncbi:MAG: HEAT repeat domain-containing protein [Oligoflexia bacterium]|nr:HEAT repeat domain-containing protein [Oligoflexia bacterium]